ncbi:ankyrin repeat domain-containing protein [Sphaerisporangium corydalis]|uniref:Ankyrin repeat domain-containing protein n=1 Tax=Sphaerisporangium corydalis TaxID=1441875 RepID=A0ABV9ELB5_9ACTN|nr:ankyrin repeat domain-containing protein [Sphaerisporangium corydalis]
MKGELTAAVRRGAMDEIHALLQAGADPSERDPDTGLTVLMIAAGLADAPAVRALLAAGADVLTTDTGAGATAVHKACQGGSAEVVRALLDAGAFVDAVAATTGHTPLMDALWFKWPEIVDVLLGHGAGLNLSTHYGFSLKEHFDYELNVNTFGKERLVESDKLLRAREEADEAAAHGHALMNAVTSGDVAAVRALLGSGFPVDLRWPLVNGFNDAHTALLVACRDGHTEIVEALLSAGADVNAVEPTFGAVPLHKAVYNGHVEITRLLVTRPGIDLGFQGATNGYSPLHDSLWHGYAECARLLVQAGAPLDLVGHDGKTPRDLAEEVLGADHEVTLLIAGGDNDRN